jgi:hypothetical protein
MSVGGMRSLDNNFNFKRASAFNAAVGLAYQLKVCERSLEFIAMIGRGRWAVRDLNSAVYAYGTYWQSAYNGLPAGSNNSSVVPAFIWTQRCLILGLSYRVNKFMGCKLEWINYPSLLYGPKDHLNFINLQIQFSLYAKKTPKKKLRDLFKKESAEQSSFIKRP